MAYYAASQILVFIAQEFGFPKVVSMLPRWGAGRAHGPGGARTSLGITPGGARPPLPRLAHARASIATRSSTSPTSTPRRSTTPARPRSGSPNDAKKQVELALALFADGQKPEGDAVLAEALRLDPKQPDAHYVQAAPGHAGEGRRRGRAPRRQDDRRRQRRLRRAHEGGRPRRAQEGHRRREAEPRGRATSSTPPRSSRSRASTTWPTRRATRTAELCGAHAHRAARPARPQGVEPAARAAGRAGRLGGGARRSARARMFIDVAELEDAPAVRPRPGAHGALRLRRLRAEQRAPLQAQGEGRRPTSTASWPRRTRSSGQPDVAQAGARVREASRGRPAARPRRRGTSPSRPSRSAPSRPSRKCRQEVSP